MNATMRTIVWGTIPIASVSAGIVASAIGVVLAIYIFGALSVFAGLWILAGPIRLREQPQPVG